MSEVMFRILKNPTLKSSTPFWGYHHYELSRVYALEGDTEGSLFYLTKARASHDMPPVELVFNKRDYAKIAAKSSDFATILFEDATHTKQRLTFEEDVRTATYHIELNTVDDLMASVSFKPLGPANNMTESMLIRDALTKSTMDFLLDGNMGISINWKAFFQPVLNPQSEAKDRLVQRMKLKKVRESANVIPGDGNCLMHSLSDQLTRNLNHHGHIRARLVAWLRSNSKLALPNGATLEEFANDQSWNDYCNSMAKNWNLG